MTELPDEIVTEVERTLDEKVSELLRQTAAIAAHDERDRVRRRSRWLLIGVLTAVLGGLLSLQVQFLVGRSNEREQARQSCETRNRQAEAVVSFIKRAKEQTRDNPEAQVAYERFLREFGPVPDCDIWK